jgi:hypothetical protein
MGVTKYTPLCMCVAMLFMSNDDERHFQCFQFLLRKTDLNAPGSRNYNHQPDSFLTVLVEKMVEHDHWLTERKANLCLSMLAAYLNEGTVTQTRLWINRFTSTNNGKSPLENVIYLLLGGSNQAKTENNAVLDIQQHKNSMTLSRVCVEMVSMLAKYDIDTKYGVLNIALRHIKDTRLCMSVCQSLLRAAPRLVNDDRRYFYDRYPGKVGLFSDAPLIAAVSRRGEDCLMFTQLLLDQPSLDTNVFVGPRTCLYYAAKHARYSHELLSLLLSYHGSVDHIIADENGRTVLPPPLAAKVVKAMTHRRGLPSFVDLRNRETAAQ